MTHRALGALVVLAVTVVVCLLPIACGDGTTTNAGPGATATTVPSKGPRDVSGTGMPADLGVYLAPTTTDADMTRLMSELFHETTPGRVGEDMIDGVLGVQGDYGVKAIYIDFSPGTTAHRVDEIIRSTEADPNVVETRRDAVVGEPL